MSRHPTHRRRQEQVLAPDRPQPAVIRPTIEAKAVPRLTLQPFPWYLWATLGAWVIFAISSALPGAVDLETDMYLPYHLSDKPFFSRIFDSKRLEWEGSYQARELSYAIDAIDCHFIAWSAHHGFPHFLSLTYFLFTLGTSLLLWRFLVGQLNLDRLSALLLIGLQLTAPCVFLSTGYFRSSKSAVMFLAMVMTVLIWRGLSNQGRNPLRWVLFGVASLAMTLCDRQGFFMVASATVFLAVYFALRRTRAGLYALIAAAAAITLSVAYNYEIAPRLTQALNGYSPSFAYQHLPWKDLKRPQFELGWYLFLDTVRFGFGDFPVSFVTLLLGGMVRAIWKRHGWMAGIFASGAIACLYAMMVLMALRHPPLAWADVRRVYYWLPSTLVIMVLAGIAVAVAYRREYALIIRIGLAAALVSNIVALPEHRAIARDRTRPNHQRAVALRKALLAKQPDPAFVGDPIFHVLRSPEQE